MRLVVVLATLLGLAIAAGGFDKSFELTVTWEKHAPDGVERDMVLVNGQFPGPTLEINQGDKVEVVVHNRMPFNTTVHFHGIEMHGTPWSDGVPGVTQRQILEGETFVYKWTATQYGSYWYHAHQLGQLEDGMYGAIVIHPKEGQPTPFSLISKDDGVVKAVTKAAKTPRPLILSDFRHRPSHEIVDLSHAANTELPCFDSILFNGKGSVNCIPPEKLTSLLTPQQANTLKVNNVTNFTPKGCLPPNLISKTVSPGVVTHMDVLPPDVLDVCTPTNGPKEVITVAETDTRYEDWVALDLIGAFSLITAVFSIDELPMWVYAVDGEYIQPQYVHALTISNGDRFSVLVNLQIPGEYPVRVVSVQNSQIMASSATLSYGIGPESHVPPRQTSRYILDNGFPAGPGVTFYNQTTQRQLEPVPMPKDVDQTHKIYMRTAGPSFQWALNSSMFPVSVLDHGSEEIVLFDPKPFVQDNVTITTRNNTWVDLILITATTPMPPHPIHKHGNKMWQIGNGIGPFPWANVNEAIAAVPDRFNLVNPPRRDGFVTAQATPTNATWTVLRYHVTNPGAWLVHCHVQSHLVGGMSMVIQDGTDHWPTVPTEYANY